MKKPLLVVALVGVGVSFAVPGAAVAPPDQYETFNRFNQRITDAYTKLVWERSTSSAFADDASIDAYCVAPTRLPTVKELLTIVDEEPNRRYDQTIGADVVFYIDTEVFPDAKRDAPYCTQTRTSGGGRFVVDFGTGVASVKTPSAPCRVRCVHYIGP